MAPVIALPFCCHWYAYPSPALAVRTALLPEQIVVGEVVESEAVGTGLTVTTFSALVFEHPLALVTLTVYEPEVEAT